VQSFTNNGFSGLITLMVGFLPDGTIQGIEVLQHAETPGLGSKMTEEGNVLTVSFEGKNPADLKMSVRKDGGDIDALTASTITSRAYTDAVDRAYRVFSNEVKGLAVEATTGATAPATAPGTAAETTPEHAETQESISHE
jgi:electron transport complex protein RnfG